MLIPTKWISRKLKWITEVVKVRSKNSKKTTSHLLKSTDRTILECITLYSKKKYFINKISIYEEYLAFNYSKVSEE